jgi:hypothetical protein
MPLVGFYYKNTIRCYYNKNKRNALISHIYYGIEFYMFRTDLLSIIRSLLLYIQQYVFVIQKLSSILISLAKSQHNLFDKYLLLCI